MLNRLLLLLAAASVTACATAPPAVDASGASYLQVMDPLSGVVIAELKILLGRSCPAMSERFARQAPSAGTLLHCSPDSVAKQLPYRSTVRSLTSGELADYHFRTQPLCLSSTEALDPRQFSVVATCELKKG